MRSLCILILVSILLCCNAITHASKQEWIDKAYDFSVPNKIFVSINCPASVNEISELEVKDIFAQKMRGISAKLQRTGRDLYGWSDVIVEMERNNIDLKEIGRNYPAKAHEMIRDYILKNYDLVVEVYVLAYDKKTLYHDGYFVNVPSTTSSLVTTPYGNGTVTTYGTTPQYVRGQYFPVIYGSVRVHAYTLPENMTVWERIDDRITFKHTKPKDVYTRIINSWASEFSKKLKAGTG